MDLTPYQKVCMLIGHFTWIFGSVITLAIIIYRLTGDRLRDMYSDDE